MVDEGQLLTWDVAIKLLDANLPFRSTVSSHGAPRSYRGLANGPELKIWMRDQKFFVELPSVIPVFHGVNPEEKATSGFRYQIFDVGQLLKCIAKIVSIVNTKIHLDEANISIKPEVKMTSRTSLNSILYGPPGTGKTFKSAQLAVSICDGVAPTDRAELMKRYKVLTTEGRISFVTFHQSYGYEDFVEGLRPEMSDGQINYRVRPGVFRDSCDAARRSTLVKPGLAGKPLRDRKIFKMSLGASGTAEGRQAFQACIENEIVLLGWGANIDYSDCKNQDEILKRATEGGCKKPESDARYVGLLKDDVKIGDIIIASHGNYAFKAVGEVVGEYEFLEIPLARYFHQKRSVRWLAVYEGTRSVNEIFDRNFTMSSLYRLDPAGVNFDVLEVLLQPQQAAANQPFVLIIDEINRANISKVFGELITLLEPDKREGQLNALHVKLPYSGDDFCVPANLHVIGTMNTSDRSIALLDTALRRRFDFEELQPDYSALHDQPVDGIDIRLLMQTINERIEYLYDRDHTIGHAYFIGVKTIAELDSLFRRKIIPLLQEYFYEDWSKVRAVLNDGRGAFIESQNSIPTGLEAVVDDCDAKARYRMKQEPFKAVDFLNIYE